MDVILHIGAHRTATTSFQGYMRDNAPALAEAGIGFWGPRRVRGGVLTGVIPVPGPLSPARQFDRARGRIAVNLARAEAQGTRQLVISEENVPGSPRGNLRRQRLYPDAGLRMAAFAAAFDGRLTRIVLSVRALDQYWRSVLTFAVARGHPMPEAALLDRLVTQPRSWREVICDLALAAPGVEILVLPHERFAGLPEHRLARMLGRETAEGLPRTHARHWLNRAPDAATLRALTGGPVMGGVPVRGAEEGLWQPFDGAQCAALREVTQDDLFWLAAGAEGLARLARDPWEGKELQDPAGTDRPGSGTGANGAATAGRIDPRARLRRRGQGNDVEEGRLGQAG